MVNPSGKIPVRRSDESHTDCLCLVPCYMCSWCHIPHCRVFCEVHVLFQFSCGLMFDVNTTWKSVIFQERFKCTNWWKTCYLPDSAGFCRWETYNDAGIHFCIYLPRNWMDLDKTWQRDGIEKEWCCKILGEITTGASKKGTKTNHFLVRNTTHCFGHFRLTDFYETWQEYANCCSHK